MAAPGDWFTHDLICGMWNHEYDAYLNHQASGARAPKRGISMDWVFCDCAHANGVAPYGPIPQPNFYDLPAQREARR